MPINFIPNDPLTLSALPLRSQAARPNRPAGRAGFTFVNQVSQALYQPGTPGFLFWQCREAALMAVETWEALNGDLTQWSSSVPNPKKLQLIQNAGVNLNAFYDRNSLSFFEATAGTKTTFTGASTDVVAHEAGHAFLDVIRPDLWDSNFPETNAFHEAMGDCMAILTVLFDKPTRVALLKKSANLGASNFVEAVMEDLSDGVRRQFGASHPSAVPRHALNNFRWQLPTTLPSSGPPSVLTSESHSFGRVFSGCFYDVIRNIFKALPVKNESSLLAATKTAGKLLIEGIKKASDTPRFFQAVGRAMALADETLNSGANRAAIREAFARHNIVLGANAMFAPRAALAGSGPKHGAIKGILSATTRSDLKQRIGADPKSRMTVNMLKIEGEPVAEAVHHREVLLAGVSGKLKGVVAIAAETTLVGNVGGRAAIVSALPESNATTDEVESFVKSLMDNNQISFEAKKPVAKAGLAMVSAIESSSNVLFTHVVSARGGKKVLERVRFDCRGCRS